MTHPFSTPSKRLFRVLGITALLFPTFVFAQYSSPVRDVENPAHSPIRLDFTLAVPNGATSISNSFATEIPFGKRMVVEFVSVTCGISAGQGVDVATLDIIVFNQDGGFTYPLLMTKSPTNGNGTNRYFVSQLVRLYADGTPGPNMGGAIALTGPGLNISCHFIVTGYTVNMP